MRTMIKATDVKMAGEALQKTILGELEADIDKTLSKMAITNSTRTTYKISLEHYESLPQTLILSLLKRYSDNGWRVQPEEFSTVWFLHPNDPDFSRDYTKCVKCNRKLFTILGVNTGQCVNTKCPNYFFRV